jgi:hypothetical protein
MCISLFFFKVRDPMIKYLLKINTKDLNNLFGLYDKNIINSKNNIFIAVLNIKQRISLYFKIQLI